jgi:hypothetical protein
MPEHYDNVIGMGVRQDRKDVKGEVIVRRVS